MNANPHKPIKGQCLCGAVKFSATLKSQDVHACHCSMCRSWAGGGFMGLDCDGPPAMESEASVGRYSASAWGERVFCKECGSSLFWQTKDGAHVSVSAGLVEVDDTAKLTLQYFIDEKPAFYAFEGDSKTMTGAEVFAAFGANEEGAST